MGESWIVCLVFVCVYGFPASFVGAEKTWAHVPLSTQSLKRGFLRNPSLNSLAGRILTFRDPLFEHFFGNVVKKVVLPCKNQRFWDSEASHPAAHGLSSKITIFFSRDCRGGGRGGGRGRGGSNSALCSQLTRLSSENPKHATKDSGRAKSSKMSPKIR